MPSLQFLAVSDKFFWIGASATSIVGRGYRESVEPAIHRPLKTEAALLLPNDQKLIGY